MFYGNKIHNIKQFQFWTIALLLFLPFTTAYAVDVDFNTMLNALKENTGPIIRFVVATAFVIGLWLIFSGILELKKAGQSSMQQQSSGIGKPLARVMIGVMLLYLPSIIDVGVWTIWGHSALGSEAESLMAYAPDPGDPFAPIKGGAIAIVRVVGYVSFVKGFLILSRSTHQGSQPGGAGKGFTHIIGGILAINIVETIRIISSSLGITVI